MIPIHKTYSTTEEITNQLLKNLNGQPQERPLLILIGGFQGAGKSTVAQFLQNEHQFTIISTDKIRFMLLEQSVTGDSFKEGVSAISNLLLEKGLQKQLNMVLDANAHTARINEAIALTKNTNYKIVKIYLKTSEEILVKRLESRPPQEGYYQGSVSDLKGSLAKTTLNSSDYDLVIDTDKKSPQEELQLIEDFFKE